MHTHIAVAYRQRPLSDVLLERIAAMGVGELHTLECGCKKARHKSKANYGSVRMPRFLAFTVIRAENEDAWRVPDSVTVGTCVYTLHAVVYWSGSHFRSQTLFSEKWTCHDGVGMHRRSTSSEKFDDVFGRAGNYACSMANNATTFSLLCEWSHNAQNPNYATA